MSYQKNEFEQLQETLYFDQLDNGLQVYVLPKRGFHKTYATFTTKYGSIENHFVSLKGDEVRVPDGIAHFLEHKMFEDETEDVFNQFSKNGAQANAFTSFDRTAYLFSSTDYVDKNIKTLLDFVQHPYFTDENVEKEKGIIEQEIRMYQDNPDWRAYFGYIGALYHHLPVKVDIAGTVESIYDITKDMLYTCYETFYHPSNMLLFVVGSVDPEEVFALVRDDQAAKSFAPPFELKRIFADEPHTVAHAHLDIDLSIGVPKCIMGYKETQVGLQGKELLKQELSTSIMMDLIAGQSTSFYQDLTQEGLIDDSFGTDYNLEKEYGFSVMGGNTKNPEQLLKRIQEQIIEIEQKGLDKEEFERCRKKNIGSFLKALNSPEYIANQFTRYRFNKMDFFDVIPTLEELSFEDINKRFKEHVNKDQFASCIVR